MERSSLEWVRGVCIGKGSFGTVNLAVNKSDGCIFAVKSVNLKTALPSHIESLENEIRILQTLSSPHVIHYLGNDLTHVSDTAMETYRNLHVEYMSGGTVAEVASQLCGKGAYVDEQIVRSYTWRILSALEYVHSRGIVHCDVKGSNVLVGPTPGVAKLADFGSARIINGEDDGGTMIVPHGTPLWMAPEVIRQERQGPESDVWSLGCTVIEMITGRPPWKDFGTATLCQIGFSDELPEFPPQLSESFRDFLEKCLRRNPSDRWTCEQLLQHPFVSADIVLESSPRSVLDWSNSEFNKDEDDDEEIKNSSDLVNFTISAKERIRELASERGVVWESEGWEVVRCGSVSDEEEREGTNSEYLNCLSGRVGSDGIKWEYLKNISCVSLDSCSCGCCKAGLGCQRLGLEKRDFVLMCWWCKLFLLFIIFRFRLLFLSWTSIEQWGSKIPNFVYDGTHLCVFYFILKSLWSDYMELVFKGR